MKKTVWYLLALFFWITACGPAPAAAPTTAPTEPPTETLPPTATPLPVITPFVVGKWRITGVDVPELASFDSMLEAFMQENNVSAGALAVTYQGRLIMAHGYTWDSDESYAIQPDSLFRIASLSKPITAAAVAKLIQDGQLSLETKITEILTFVPIEGETVDARLADVTVADLLYHRGGWDIAQLGYDPMFHDRDVSRALAIPMPISQENIITYMSGVPLNHDPGTKYAYSNYGYMLLGRIIEQVSGQPYETYVTENMLAPLKITDMQLGHSLPDGRLPGEVEYRSDYTSTTVLDESGDSVRWPYGGWNLENMDSHGGWLASAVDMARFEASFDLPENNPVFTADSIKLMFTAPPGGGGSSYYAMGWEVRPAGGSKMNTWHTGSLDGTFTIMVRRSDGVDWILLLNKRDSTRDPKGEAFVQIDGLLHKAADAVDTWPDHDLFTELP